MSDCGCFLYRLWLLVVDGSCQPLVPEKLLSVSAGNDGGAARLRAVTPPLIPLVGTGAIVVVVEGLTFSFTVLIEFFFVFFFWLVNILVSEGRAMAARR